MAHVLLVEDGADERATLREMLESLDLVVDEADGPEQALEILDHNPDHYQWLVTDNNMPGKDDGLILALVAMSQGLSAVVITATTEGLDDASAEVLILTKPVPRSKLEEMFL